MEYVFQCRMRRAMTLLRTKHGTSASIATRVGYGSEAAFSAAFVQHQGITPGAYRRQVAQLVAPAQARMTDRSGRNS